ncbi:hypothetical protein GCM10009789_49730 [Kribbella sancticallisti]|uniref:Uncharacterized protein n=2 Tax=Kribbella sancticallisti TaxID=460087 RepID=A0ABP4PWU3_9ACTN
MRTIWAAAVAVAALTTGFTAAPAHAAASASAGAASAVAVASSASAGTVVTSASAATGAARLAVPDNLSPEAQYLLDRLPEARARAEAVSEKLGLDTTLQRALINAIDPTQYECSNATPPVVAAIMAPAAKWNFEQLLAALHVLIYNMALIDAAYLPQTGPFSYGPHGEYTNAVTHTYRDLRNFWDIPSGDIELVPAHGRAMLDPELNYRVFTKVYGLADAPSRVSADFVAKQLNSEAMGYGDLPMFTFNAYAAPGEVLPGIGQTPKRIAFGDGVMAGFDLVGLGDVAPKAILAHEFGHHIQFADNLMRTDLPAPEASRWAELSADAFSSYFLTHARGTAMQWKRVQLFSQLFYQIGDCGFTVEGHHGTPTQRMRSALWAYNVGNSARPQGHILPALTFFDLFKAQYPQLIAPDAPN